MLVLVKLVLLFLVFFLPKHLPKHQPSLRLGFLTGQGMTVSYWGENVPLTSLLAVNQPNVWVTTTTLLVFRSPKLHLILPRPQLLLLHVPFVMINQLKV